MKIKKATKLLALAISAIMLISIVPMVASAAASLEITDVDMNVLDSDLLEFVVTYNATEVEQVTILAVVGEATVDDQAPAAGDGNIAYIDQQATEGNTSFTFKVARNRFSETENKLYIKMGGTALESAVKGETQTNPDVTPADIILANGDNATITVTTVGTTIQSYIGPITTIALGATIPAGKIPQAYIDNVATGTTFYSTERNKYILVLPIGTTATPVFKAIDGTVDAANTIVKYGNLNTDADVTALDKTAVNLFVQKPAQAPIRTNIKYLLSADVNGDGQINAQDKTAVNLKVQKGAAYSFSILTK